METVPINLEGKEYQWLKSDLGWFDHMVDEGHLERTEGGYRWTYYNFKCHMINAKKLSYFIDNRWFLYYLTKLRIELGLF